MDIRPSTPDFWPALEDMFGAKGTCKGCWRMYWRIGAAHGKRPGEKNQAEFEQILRKGPPTGLIAFEGERAAEQAGAPAQEAYPLDGDKSPSVSGTEYLSTFLRAGFKVVACHSPERPIVRHGLKVKI